jgi:hypothetical protein
VTLGDGVVVWLCAGHAGHEFQTRRSGRDFVGTLSGGPIPKAAAGKLRVAGARLEVQAADRDGLRPHHVADSIHTTDATCPAHPPSRRTLQRWNAQRRWLTARPP